MKKKINLLIGFSALVLVVLSAIQYYLVKTTYEYKVEQFRSEIKAKIAKITNDYSDIDSTIFSKKDLLYKQLAENYLRDKSTRFHIKNALLQNEFKSELTRKLQEEFENEIPNLTIDFAIVLDKFVIYDATKEADTIFAEKPFIENKLYGDLASLDDAFLIRNYVGTTSGSFKKQELNSDYKLLTEDTLYVSIKNWEYIVLKRMALILIFAVFSILTLITLFVIALKALIKQKKISDIKTDFINNITHELKTPLTTLSVSTKILERKEIRDNEETYNTVLGTIIRQNNRLQNLIDQVMTNSLGYEEIELHKEKVLMPDFLNSIINDFQIAYPDILIEKMLDSKKISINLDKFHLTTAITNVLENAVKYGCTNIKVTSSLQEGQFAISISDDGIGISKNKHSLLFDKFYRVEQGDLHDAKGLGLGLYYVDQIIKAHQGSIHVISDLGKGATFDLRLQVSNG
ncbi:MAG: HAMP domain-containing histidine kinase [Flavobacterium sp.]|uniref:sensor histidine kinase n=1 Tax=Flavobacterium sp. Leaf359 TaxID=1736351 RepID=UPI0006F2E12F|nr:HAMP domain-containing sensor histidine kinase [Flavobacterium sp. Leaf359]KQS52552.1 histidine kinase [Flavobacterium sp. Leaf359]MBU7571418.1 HAMP domain-containing histidine kinase [Flavobacterium sp.]PZO32780.1 MAG: sensor histidine kinase [Flavobacteriaceae bacterium]